MNDDDVLTAITRMDANLKALISRVDWMRSDIQDHEGRIRELENKQNTLLGKLTALWIISTAAVGGAVAWVTSWH